MVRYGEEPAIVEADTANAQHLVTRPKCQHEQVTQRVRMAHNAFTFPQFFFGPALVFGELYEGGDMPRRITKGLSSVRRNGGRRNDAGNGIHAATRRVKAKFPTPNYRRGRRHASLRFQGNCNSIIDKIKYMRICRGCI